MITGSGKPPVKLETDPATLAGQTWVTRQNIFVDRMACGWLIRRFIDSNAKFLFVAGDDHSPEPDHVRFDMHGGEYTHQGDKCSFEVMAEALCRQDKALTFLSEVVHDIDLKETKFGHSETDGFKAMLTGITACEADDLTRLDKSMPIFEHMYAYFRRQSSG